MELVVRDILPILEERGGKLVAGADGLNRLVEYFDMLEQPDIKPWLRPHLLMITTGYAVRNDEQALLRLIDVLHEGAAAALVIKTRFFDVFPQEAVDYCEKLGLPLILLENQVGFVEITQPIMEAIINAKNEINLTENFRITEKEEQELHTRLFLDILVNRIEEGSSLDYRIHLLKWPLPPFHMAVLRMVDTEQRKFLMEEDLEEIYKTARRVLSASYGQTAVFLKKEEVICLFSGAKKSEEMGKVLEGLHQRLEKMLRTKIQIGVSGAIMDYPEIAVGYKDVQDALRIGFALHGASFVSEIEKNRYEQLFLRMSRDPYWEQFAKEHLKRLEHYDFENNMNLVETLELMITYTGNRKKVAEVQFLHRNTMAYRVKKIEDLTQSDLSDGETLIRLGIALRVRRYL